MSSNESSTGQSYLDQATGMVQSAIGSLTGSTADKAQAEDRKLDAQARDDLSHTAAKAGPYTATPDGVAKDDPRRTEGSWNQTIGSGKETLGNLVGHQGLKQAGQEQNAQGKEQEAAGQLADFGGGVADRAKGALGGTVAGVMGDAQGQERYQSMHDQGKTQQRGAEVDIQKQAPRE